MVEVRLFVHDIQGEEHDARTGAELRGAGPHPPGEPVGDRQRDRHRAETGGDPRVREHTGHGQRIPVDGIAEVGQHRVSPEVRRADDHPGRDGGGRQSDRCQRAPGPERRPGRGDRDQQCHVLLAGKGDGERDDRPAAPARCHRPHQQADARGEQRLGPGLLEGVHGAGEGQYEQW